MAKRWPPLRPVTARSPCGMGGLLSRRRASTAAPRAFSRLPTARMAKSSRPGKAGASISWSRLLGSAYVPWRHRAMTSGPSPLARTGIRWPLVVWMKKLGCGTLRAARISRFWAERHGSLRWHSVGTGRPWHREMHAEQLPCGMYERLARSARSRRTSITAKSVVSRPPGVKLRLGGDDGWIRLWDFGTQRELLAINAHSYRVSSLSLQSDGKTLASGSFDGTAKVWDLTSGAAIAIFHNETPDTSGGTVGEGEEKNDKTR